MESSKHKISLRAKIIIYCILLILIINIFSGIALIKYYEDIIIQENGINTLNILRFVIEEIDKDKLSDIISNNWNQPYYSELRAYLKKVKSNTGIKYLYIEAYDKNGKGTIYVVDGDDPAEGFGVPVNLPDEIIDTKESLAALNGIEGYSKVDYSKKWGALISAYIPIKDKDGKIIAILGGDQPLEKVKILKNEAIFIISEIFIIAAVIAALTIRFAVTKVLSPLNKIMKGIEKIKKGNFEYQTKVQTNDELGVLSENFDSMTAYIRELLFEQGNNLRALKDKNDEIVEKSEEISALYEETFAMNEELSSLVDEIRKNYLITVKSLANAIEAKDRYTKGHCERVTKYSLVLGMKLGLNEIELIDLEYAGLLHDIGKIGIPNNVLNKPSKLTDEEYNLMKEHPKIGYEILKDIPFLEKSINIIIEHHERPDGKGYPNSLTKDKISLPGKILAVSDAFDAMTSKRPYRHNPLILEEAISQLTKNRGTQFDEAVVDAFIELIENGDIVLYSELE